MRRDPALTIGHLARASACAALLDDAPGVEALRVAAGVLDVPLGALLDSPVLDRMPTTTVELRAAYSQSVAAVRYALLGVPGREAWAATVGLEVCG